MDEKQRRAIEKMAAEPGQSVFILGYPGNAEPSFVNLNKKREVWYWAVKFGCGREHLQFAVEHVGTNPEEVEKFVYGLR